jgi:hypothetical protein
MVMASSRERSSAPSPPQSAPRGDEPRPQESLLRNFWLKRREPVAAVGCRGLRVSRQTVRKAIAAVDTEGRYRREAPQGLPQLGAFVARLEELLTANAERSRRERLTWRRIFEVLRSEGYAGGYDSVRRYARRWTEQRASMQAAVYSYRCGLPRARPISSISAMRWSSWAG